MAITKGSLTIFKITVSSVLTAVGQIVDITGPDITHDTFETTSLSSANKTYEATGVPDGGEVTLTIQYDPASATHAELITLAGTGANNAMTITLTDPGPTVIAFTGVVTGFSLNQIQYNEKVTASVKLKSVAALPTYTVGS